MNNIMVDNWFMEDVIADLRDNSAGCSNSYADLLMAIVLWDHVYYPQNNYNWWNSFPSQVQNALCPIEDNREEGLDQAIRLLCQHGKCSEEEYNWIQWKDLQQTESDIVASGAFRYMMLSNKNECDYLPCAKRRSFLHQYSSAQNVQHAMSRLKMQRHLDKTVEEYYTDTYKALLDFSDLRLKMPVLVNFIFDNMQDGMTPIDYAFHLKNEGPVIRYRQYFEEVEDALELQNWKELRFLLRCSNDIIADVTSLDKRMLESAVVSIIPTPSVSLKFKGIETTISSSPSLELKHFSDRTFKKMHLTFLKDLTQYAINDMKRW